MTLPDAYTTAVQDRSRLTLTSAREEAAVGSGVTDPVLTLWLVAAKEAADKFMANPFLDEEGEERSIPELVEQGVLAFLRVMREVSGATADSSGEGGGGGAVFGVTSERVGDVSITRSAATMVGSAADTTKTAEGLALAIRSGSEYWQMYRLPGVL